MGSSKSIPMVSQPRDKIVIVTGANTGIGYETAKFIAMMGCHVVIACRSEEKAKDAIKRMNEEFQKEKKSETENVIQDDELSVEFMKCDLASLKSTKAFISAFKAKHKHLHVLICNAAVLSQSLVTTEDNFELAYQVNYLSHFLILAELLPTMKNSGEDCRIVLVSSEAHRYSGGFDPDYAAGKIPKQEHFDGFKLYSRTKLYQIMQMYIIDRIIEKTFIEICCVHPGLVNTGLFREKPNCKLGCFLCLATCCGQRKSPHEGAATSIYAAITPELSGISRAYYTKSKSAPRWPSTESRNEELQTYLFESTKELLQPHFSPGIMQELDLPPLIVASS